MFRKGSVLVWEDEPTPPPVEAETEPATAQVRPILLSHPSLDLHDHPVLTSPSFAVLEPSPIRRALTLRFTSSPIDPRRSSTAEQEAGQEDRQNQAEGGGRA